jgi:hypothetical protein
MRNPGRTTFRLLMIALAGIAMLVTGAHATSTLSGEDCRKGCKAWVDECLRGCGQPGSPGAGRCFAVCTIGFRDCKLNCSKE